MTEQHSFRSPRSEKGQSLVEFAFLIPLATLLTLGVIEIGYALLDQHVVTKLTREGSNLISRDASLKDARIAITTMSTRPVNFSSGSKVIFSVLKKVGSVGAANYDHIVLYQRHEWGTMAGSNPSQLATTGGSFGPEPDYVAINSDNDTSLRIVSPPAYLNIVRGGLMYVTEVYSTHDLLTPLQNFGVAVPSKLYSIAYF